MIISLFYIFSATLLWAFVNIIDKYITSQNLEKYPLTLSIAHAWVQILVIPIFILLFFSKIEFNFYYVVPIIGILDFSATYLYYVGLKKAKVSVVAILLKTTPFFVLIFSLVLLDSFFTIIQYIGMVCFIIASLLVSDFSVRNGLKIDKSSSLIIIASALLALSSVLRKISINNGDSPYTIMFWSVIFMVVISIPFYMLKNKPKKGISKIFLKNRKNSVYYIISGFFEFFGLFLYTFSIIEIDVSIASFISSSQPVFVFIISAILTFKKYSGFNFNYSIRNILKLIIAMILILIGTYLI